MGGVGVIGSQRTNRSPYGNNTSLLTEEEVNQLQKEKNTVKQNKKAKHKNRGMS